MYMKLQAICGVLLCLTALSQTPDDIYEKGVYAENVLGDLDKAYQNYEIAAMDPTATRDIQVKARFRMAACALKIGDTLRAEFVVDGLAKGFPDFPEVVAQAKSLLMVEKKETDFKWKPIPWEDGEFIISRIQDGNKIHLAVVQNQLTQHNGAQVLRSFLSVNHSSYMDTLLVYQTPKTLRPLEVRYLRMGVHAVADGNKIKMTRTTPNKDYVSEFTSEGPFYWYSQRFILMRLLNHKEKEPSPIPFFFAPFGQFTKVTYQMGVPEIIEGTHGSYETVGIKGMLGLSYWLNVKSPHHYVRSKVAADYYELAEIGIRDLDVPLSYENPELGFSLVVPPMCFLHHDVDFKDKSRLHFLSLDPETGMALDIFNSNEPQRVLAFDGYREINRTESRRDGLPMVLVEGEYQAKNKTYVHYQTIIKGKKKHAVFTAWSPSQKFESAKKEMTEMVSSFKMME